MSDLQTESATLLNRVERRKQRTRSDLKLATLQLLEERGYSALTIQAITERADVGYGTFYLYFQDKDEIVWAALEEMATQFTHSIDERTAHLRTPQREYYSWVYTFQFAEAYRSSYLTLFGKRGSSTLNRRMIDYLVALHAHNLQQGHYSAGLDLPIEVMAQFIVGAFWQLLMWWLEEPQGRTPEDMAALLFQLVYRQPPPLEGA